MGYVESGYGEDEEVSQRGGNLGNAVLQDFILTLDYPGRMVRIESVTE